MIVELTGLDIANASLLDEATAAAEAMTLFYRHRHSQDANIFFASENCFPQTLALLKTRAEPLNIKLEIGNEENALINEKCFGVLLQYPNVYGEICNFENYITKLKSKNIIVALATDLLALTLIKSPKQIGADLALGSSGRFGVPLGFGGPHAAFFATKKEFSRSLPGRLIGQSLDRLGNQSYRLTLQTREQHIRREKATSNICTAQALLAIIASMYAIYHGPEGLIEIANKIHYFANILKTEIEKLGVKQINKNFFDTLTFELSEENFSNLRKTALSNKINFNYHDYNKIKTKNLVSISIDESTDEKDIELIIETFRAAVSPRAGSRDKRQAGQAVQVGQNVGVPTFQKNEQKAAVVEEAVSTTGKAWQAVQVGQNVGVPTFQKKRAKYGGCRCGGVPSSRLSGQATGGTSGTGGGF